MNLLLRSHYYVILFCWIWVCLVWCEEIDEGKTGTTEYGSSSPWPIVVAAAVHACISIGALLQLWNAPVPVPKRLSPAVKPISYAVEFIPDYQHCTFTGQESLFVEVFHDTNSITLHAEKLVLDKSTISVTRNSTGERVVISDVEEEIQNKWFIILLASELHQGEVYRVDINNFTGHITNSRLGILKHSYDDSGERWILLTHFEPNGARYAFPCFDEPSFKARFSISIATPPGKHALSNMPLMEASEPVSDHPGWVWSRFQESVPMSTYLVGFVVSNLVGVHGARNFSVWVQPGKEAEASLMVELGLPLLAELEKFTGLPFMLPKLDNIAIPPLASMSRILGTENWGLITYTDSHIIFDERKASKWQKRTMVHVLAHELSHNWFGNLVTPQFWNELWLKEGFARYMQFYATSKVLPTWEMESDYQVNVLHRSLVSGDPSILNKVVNTGNELRSKYNMRTYDTGSVLIRMMEHILTRDIFVAGVRDYLKAYSYQAASAQQFFEKLDAAANKMSSHGLPPGIGMEEIMRPWLSQTRNPIVTVTRDYSSGQVTVCQEDVETKGQRWWVPLSYTTQSKLNFNVTCPKLWLSPNDTCINMTGVASHDEWIIFNIRQAGYYRVTYDQQNWQMLADFLKSDSFNKIDIMNRAQLLDDILVLTKLKLVDTELAMNMTSYLVQETSPFPWFITIKAFLFNEDLDSNFFMELSKSFYKLIKGFPLDILSKNAPPVWERVISYACDYSVSPDCIEDAYNHFKTYQTNSSNISIDSRLGHIICYALQYKQSKGEDLMFIWNEAKKNQYRQEFLSDLQSCPGHRELIRSLMEAVVTDGDWLTSSERSQIIRSTCIRRVSTNILEEILMLLKNKYTGSYPPADLYLLHTVTSAINIIPSIKNEISEVWCTLTLSWLTGTPFVPPE
ncbi:aminopeptidase N isoform X1 [Anabrus simplex]|uniref:aminopeptidase N isoform X1 n=1 Tax=Anabrus simplex TaxID=316456 RepID=UPI0035A32EAB